MQQHPRLTSVLRPTGGMTIAFDHGHQGVPVGLEDPRARMRDVLKLGPDAIIAGIGLLRAMRDEITSSGAGVVGAVDAVVEVDGVARARTYLASMEQLAGLSVDVAKVLFHLNWSGERFAQEMTFIADAVREAGQLGLPVMVEPILIGPEAPKDAAEGLKRVIDGCRISVELGADVLKAPILPQAELKELVDRSFVPVVVLGGPAKDQEAFLRELHGAFEVGVRGLAVGRNAWSGRDAVANVTAMRMIVDNGDLDGALRAVGVG